MSFADIAACAQAQSKLLERAGARRDYRAALDTLADLARVFAGKTAKSAEKLLAAIAGDVGPGADSIELAAGAAEELLDLYAPLKPKATFTAAIAFIVDAGRAYPDLSAASLAVAAQRAALAAAAKKRNPAGGKAATPSMNASDAKAIAERFAAKFEATRLRIEGYRPILDEMKSHKPKLPADVWIGVANAVLDPNPKRTERNAKKSLETMISAAEGAHRAARGVDRAYAMGGR